MHVGAVRVPEKVKKNLEKSRRRLNFTALRDAIARAIRTQHGRFRALMTSSTVKRVVSIGSNFHSAKG